MKKVLFRYVIFTITVFTMLVSCRSESGRIIPQKNMYDLMFDMYLAESIIADDGMLYTPEVQISVIDSVLNKYSVTRQDWDVSMDYYARNLKIFFQINDSVTNRLRGCRAGLDEKVEESNIYRDLVINRFNDPTYVAPTYTFDAPLSQMGFSFVYDSIRTQALTNDSLSFSFSVAGINRVYPVKIKSGLVASYHDTTIVVFDSISTAGHYKYGFTRFLNRGEGVDTLKSFCGYLILQDSIRCVKGPFVFDISIGGDGKDAILESDSIDELGSRIEL